MSEQSTKPKGTFAKLMSSSPLPETRGRIPGIPETPIAGKPENPKTGIQGIRESGIPETPKSGNHDSQKAIKYSTQLHKETILRLKQYALVNDAKDYEVVEDAITEYLNKRESGIPETPIAGKPENPKTHNPAFRKY
jgi:hypothetical protein